MSGTDTSCRSQARAQRPPQRRLVLGAAALLIPLAVSRAQQPATSPPAVPQLVQRPPVDTAPPVALAFQGTTVIDVATGRRLPNQTIVVVGNRIQAVGSASRVRLPAGTRSIHAEGTFVIPGLWDMHTHVFDFPNTFFPLFLANGVTGIRDMGSPFLDSMVLWRREIKEGRRAGPRIVTAGPSVVNQDLIKSIKQSMPKWWVPHQVGVDSPEEGRRIVDSLKQGGADFIKVYDWLSRDAFFAIAAEARRLELPFAGHLPGGITLQEAVDSGQHSIEHDLPGSGCFDTLTVANAKRCREAAAYLRRNDAWLMRGPFMNLCGPCQLPWYRDQDRYWPDSLYDSPLHDSISARPPHEPRAWNLSLEEWAAIHNPQRRPDLGLAYRSGVPLIAGTDVAPYGLVMSAFRPGFSVHDMLWDLAHSGLTPLEVLQTATLNPAKYFHATDSMGTVAPGKVAEFLFLDGDPLVDIFNTRRIRALVADGRFYDRSNLDSLLVGAERLAKQSRRP